MLKGVSNKKYEIKVEDVEEKPSGKALDSQVKKADEQVEQVKEMMQPHIVKQDTNEDLYQAADVKYSSQTDAKYPSLDIYSENRNEGSMRRGMKQIMEL